MIFRALGHAINTAITTGTDAKASDSMRYQKSAESAAAVDRPPWTNTAYSIGAKWCCASQPIWGLTTAIPAAIVAQGAAERKYAPRRESDNAATPSPIS